MSYYATPPQHLVRRTAADIRWSESWRRYGPEVEQLLSLTARPAKTAGGSAEVETPGPASTWECDYCAEVGEPFAGSNVCRACYEAFGGPTEA